MLTGTNLVPHKSFRIKTVTVLILLLIFKLYTSKGDTINEEDSIIGAAGLFRIFHIFLLSANENG